MTYDWTRFSITFFYYAPRERVFAAWATPRGLESFFVRSARFSGRGPDDLVVAGDRYEWAYVQDYAHGGEVLEVVPGESVAYTFGSMRVDVTVKETGDGVRVDLVQSNIPDTEEGRPKSHLNCRSCWLFFMTNLKSILEHGIDLRDRTRPGRASSMEVGYPA